MSFDQILEHLQILAEQSERENLAQRERIQAFASAALIRTDLPKAYYLAAEVFRLSLADTRDSHAPERSPFLSNREYTRKLGLKLHKLGGFSLMKEVADLVPRYDQRELDLAWDAIGDWRA